MNRDDWVFVGMRLIGLWLAVQSLVGVAAILTVQRQLDGSLRENRFWFLGSSAVSLLISFLVGAGLFLGASYLDDWIRKKDARRVPRSSAVRD